MKTQFVVCLAFLAGTISGTLLSHPGTVHAQGGFVTVKEVLPLTTQSSVLTTGTVVGFSCTRGSDGNPDCYIATQ